MVVKTKRKHSSDFVYPQLGWLLSVRLEDLKALFGCLKREKDINLKELPNIINSCFVLNNFCEERKEPINGKRVEAVIRYEKEFQPPIDGGYKVSNNETGGKSIRQVYVKYFE